MRQAPLALAVLFASSLPALASTVIVRVEGIVRLDAAVKVALCDRSFEPAGCPKGASRMPKAEIEEFVFEDVRDGPWAVAVYQDLDGDGAIGTVLGGLPTEPYGFSNDIGRWRPPSFERALINIGPGRTVVAVRLAGLMGGPA